MGLQTTFRVSPIMNRVHVNFKIRFFPVLWRANRTLVLKKLQLSAAVQKIDFYTLFTRADFDDLFCLSGHLIGGRHGDRTLVLVVFCLDVIFSCPNNVPTRFFGRDPSSVSLLSLGFSCRPLHWFSSARHRGRCLKMLYFLLPKVLLQVLHL